MLHNNGIRQIRRIFSEAHGVFRQILRDYKDTKYILKFLNDPELSYIPISKKMNLIKKFYLISSNVECPHSQREILEYINTILTLRQKSSACIVEAGCYKGGSTAKFSLAAEIANKKLIIFDSFEGIPENSENHGKDIFNSPAGFNKGDYCGTLAEVKKNVSRFGKIETCEFIKGWFDDTMPRFNKRISAIYIDVDLVSSSKTCIKYLYPLLEPGGYLYSQDGHLPLIIDLFNDKEFWENEVCVRKPVVQGLGRQKLIRIKKD